MKFKPTTKFPSMSSLQGYVATSYEELVELFGEPNSKGDGYKVSTEWILENEKGEIVTIYDYKETNLYDRSYPSIETFRNLPSYEWHIGGNRMEGAVKELVEVIESGKNE